MSDEELDIFCHEHNYIGWFSTSAKSGLNVKRGMNYIISKILVDKKRIGQQGLAESEHRVDLNHSCPDHLTKLYLTNT